MRRHFGGEAAWMLAGLAVACWQTAVAGPIIPISQERSVYAFVIVPPCGGAVDSDQESAVGFDPFQAAIDAVHICDFAQGIACSVQYSEIGATDLLAFGNTTASAASSQMTVIHAIPSSYFNVQFQVGVVTELRINGAIGAQGAAPIVLAGALVRLEDGKGNEIASQNVEPERDGASVEEEVHIAVILQPGVYSVRADASSVIDSMVPPGGSGSAMFSLLFHAAIPGDVNGDDIVNIDDLFDVIGSWGSCAEAMGCDTDIAPLGGNEEVDIDDLFKVVAAWSPEG